MLSASRKAGGPEHRSPPWEPATLQTSILELCS